jgi:rhodanese-related sulfurtransferase
VADQYQAEGFTNVEALEGGVEAWTKAGYGVVAPA